MEHLTVNEVIERLTFMRDVQKVIMPETITSVTKIKLDTDYERRVELVSESEVSHDALLEVIAVAEVSHDALLEVIAVAERALST